MSKNESGSKMDLRFVTRDKTLISCKLAENDSRLRFLCWFSLIDIIAEFFSENIMLYNFVEGITTVKLDPEKLLVAYLLRFCGIHFNLFHFTNF